MWFISWLCSWSPDRRSTSAACGPRSRWASALRQSPHRATERCDHVRHGRHSGPATPARAQARCAGHPRLLVASCLKARRGCPGELERDEIRLGRDDGPFFFSCPERNAARVLRTGAQSTLHGVVFAILCPGPAVHRPWHVEDARERAYKTLRCVRDTRSLLLRAYGESIQLQPITL